MALDALSNIEDNANSDKEGGTSKEVAHFFCCVYDFKGKDGCEGYDYEEDGAGEGDFAEDAIDIFGGIFTYFDSWYKAVATFEFVCHFCGVDEDGGVEEATHKDECAEDKVVLPAISVLEYGGYCCCFGASCG